jgi:hypothetical protein
MTKQELERDRELGALKTKQRRKQQLVEKLSNAIGRVHIDPAPDPDKAENDGVATIEDPRGATRAADAEMKQVIDDWVSDRIRDLVRQTPKLRDRVCRKWGHRPVKAVIVCENSCDEYWRKYWFRIEPHLSV